MGNWTLGWYQRPGRTSFIQKGQMRGRSEDEIRQEENL
jgi:hypothetical protein